MGDRGNIVVRQGKTNRDDVWFYTHWSGYNIEDVAREALARRLRWDDTSYLARIVFDTLTKGEQGEETGFGISTGITDNEHDIVVIDVPNQRVFKIKEKELEDGRIPDDYEPTGAVPFEKFIEAVPVASEESDEDHP
jgi:hypothetical protein